MNHKLIDTIYEARWLNIIATTLFILKYLLTHLQLLILLT